MAILPILAFGQTGILNPPQDNQGNDLVGVWQTGAPLGVDYCKTREPFSPNIRQLYNITQGGTMTEENGNPIVVFFSTTSNRLKF